MFFFFFFFFRMSRPSGNLVIATELLIAWSGRVFSNVGPWPFGFAFYATLQMDGVLQMLSFKV